MTFKYLRKLDKILRKKRKGKSEKSYGSNRPYLNY